MNDIIIGNQRHNRWDSDLIVTTCKQHHYLMCCMIFSKNVYWQQIIFKDIKKCTFRLNMLYYKISWMGGCHGSRPGVSYTWRLCQRQELYFFSRAKGSGTLLNSGLYNRRPTSLDTCRDSATRYTRQTVTRVYNMLVTCS